MNIILANGVVLAPLTVTGEKRVVQGVTRDVLTFTFSNAISLDELNKLFIADNCETITITEIKTDERGVAIRNNFIHSGYTIRENLKCESIMVTPATAEAEAVYEDRITVSMAQRTYMETQLASLTETLDILVMEKLMEEVTE